MKHSETRVVCLSKYLNNDVPSKNKIQNIYCTYLRDENKNDTNKTHQKLQKQ